jgi:hypothetical protein
MDKDAAKFVPAFQAFSDLAYLSLQSQRPLSRVSTFCSSFEAGKIGCKIHSRQAHCPRDAYREKSASALHEPERIRFPVFKKLLEALPHIPETFLTS